MLIRRGSACKRAGAGASFCAPVARGASGARPFVLNRASRPVPCPVMAPCARPPPLQARTKKRRSTTISMCQTSTRMCKTSTRTPSVQGLECILQPRETFWLPRRLVNRLEQPRARWIPNQCEILRELRQPFFRAQFVGRCARPQLRFAPRLLFRSLCVAPKTSVACEARSHLRGSWDLSSTGLLQE